MEGRKRSSLSAGGSEQAAIWQNVGGQTDVMSPERKGIIALMIHCYLTPNEVIVEDMS